MNDIERRAARILELGRAEPAPSLADVERVREALRARYSADPALFTPGAAGASAGGSASLKVAIFKALGLGATLGVGVSVGVHVLQPSPREPEVTPSIVTIPAPATSAPAEVPSAAPRPPEPEASSFSSARPAQQGPKSAPSGTIGGVTLEREIALLREAQGALHRGAPERALSLLATLDRERPQGALIEEREAARAIARCRLGLGSAEALASFERTFARSVHAAGVRAACGGDGLVTGDGNGAPEH